MLERNITVDGTNYQVSSTNARRIGSEPGCAYTLQIEQEGANNYFLVNIKTCFGEDYANEGLLRKGQVPLSLGDVIGVPLQPNLNLEEDISLTSVGEDDLIVLGKVLEALGYRSNLDKKWKDNVRLGSQDVSYRTIERAERGLQLDLM